MQYFINNWGTYFCRAHRVKCSSYGSPMNIKEAHGTGLSIPLNLGLVVPIPDPMGPCWNMSPLPKVCPPFSNFWGGYFDILGPCQSLPPYQSLPPCQSLSKFVQIYYPVCLPRVVSLLPSRGRLKDVNINPFFDRTMMTKTDFPCLD